MRPKHIMAITVTLIAYFAAYAFAYNLRSPAANLAYWCYTSEKSAPWMETAAFRVFYPAYRVHLSVSAIGRHNFDREPIFADSPTGL
jgi:hypothetical protein